MIVHMRRATVTFLVASLGVVLSASCAQGRLLPSRFFGIVPQTPLSPTDTATMRAGRIGSIRTPVEWSVVEPAPGRYDWYGLDGAVALAAAAGMEVLPYLYGTPAWLAARPTQLPVGTIEQRAAWSAFLQAAVARYGPGGSFWAEHGPSTADPLPSMPIRKWQVWNEPNFFYFADPASPTLYGRLLKLSARSLRSVDPRAKVLLGSLFGRPDQRPPRAMSAADFLQRLYRIRGIKRFFDGLTLDPYAANQTALRRNVWQVRRAALASGDRRTGLFVTELGWGSQNDPRKVAFEVGRKGQARELRKAYRYLISRQRQLNLKAIYWFSWQDAAEPSCNFCDSAGLFYAGEPLRPKPAWRAFVGVTHTRVGSPE
jgi:hypothetical protein